MLGASFWSLAASVEGARCSRDLPGAHSCLGNVHGWLGCVAGSCTVDFQTKAEHASSMSEDGTSIKKGLDKLETPKNILFCFIMGKCNVPHTMCGDTNEWCRREKRLQYLQDNGANKSVDY